MRNIIFLSFALMMLMSIVISNAQTQKKEALEANQIEAYYPHNSSRCITCRTV